MNKIANIQAYPVNGYSWHEELSDVQELMVSSAAFLAAIPWHLSMEESPGHLYDGFLLLVKSYNGNVERYQIMRDQYVELKRKLL